MGTYTFYAVVTSSAAGTLGTAFLTQVGIWPDPPSWGPFVLTAVALIGAWLLAVLPARRGTSTLLAVEGATIAVILLVTVVILVRLLAGNAPSGARFTLDVFVPETGLSGVFLGAVFDCPRARVMVVTSGHAEDLRDRHAAAVAGAVCVRHGAGA